MKGNEYVICPRISSLQTFTGSTYIGEVMRHVYEPHVLTSIHNRGIAIRCGRGRLEVCTFVG